MNSPDTQLHAIADTLHIVEPTLEDIFLHIAGGGTAVGAEQCSALLWAEHCSAPTAELEFRAPSCGSEDPRSQSPIPALYSSLT